MNPSGRQASQTLATVALAVVGLGASGGLLAQGRPAFWRGASLRQGAKAGAPGRAGVCAEGSSRLVPCWTSNAVPKVWMLLGLATPSTYHHSHTARSRDTSSSM